MSFVLTVPESISTAAADLGGIGSALEQAAAAAAGPTTGLTAAAADEVSIAVSRLFAAFGEDFTALTGQAAAFHAAFVGLLNGGAAAYLSTEVANAEQTLASAPVLGGIGQQAGGAASAITGAITGVPGLAGLLGPGAAATGAPGGAYQQLFANTEANLQSLFGAWQADPFPFLRQVIANQMRYWQQIAAAVTYTVQNFPAVVAGLPAAVQAAAQQLLAFNPVLFAEQFVTTQLGFAQTFGTALGNMAIDLVNGLPAFQAGLQTAFHAVLTGDYFGAVNDVAQAFANLLVTGFNPGPVTIDLAINFPDITVTAGVNPTLLGPLGDFFSIMNIPGQEAQYFTNLIPPSIPREMAQNFTNVLNVLTIPSISAIATLDVQLGLPPTATASLDTFFGLPLVLSYAVAGAPLSTLNGFATSATAVQQALLAGDPAGAIGALIDAPAVVTNAFLNSDTIVDMTVPVPINLPPNPFIPSFSVPIILHLPFDGILVPPHPLTATIDLSGAGLPSVPITIGGTPFMGLAPLLINYLPQQLANAITPAG